MLNENCSYICRVTIIKKIIMKKFMFAAVAVLALASCKKDYTCKYEGYETETYTGLNKTQKDVAKSACELGGGTWSAK